MPLFHTNPIRKSFRNIPRLETERLILRKILPSDTDDMFEYSKEPCLTEFLLWEPHPNRSFTKKHILYLQKQYAHGAFFDWGIIEKKSGKFIGTCGFTEIYENEMRAEVGYVLSPAFQRMGIAPEALRCVMQYGFSVLGLKKLSGRLMEDNAASEKILLREGFTPDTRKEEFFLKNGKNQRILTYSISYDEYKKKH